LTFQIIDGGGIRGLASLYILKQIMAQLEAQLEVPAPILPCNYFDLIAGTSTGG
jgi:patatin-like phospholipase/acyl hydrolase